MIWPQARPWLAPVIDLDPVGRYRLDDVLRGLLNATLRLWISWDDERKEVEAAVVTEIVQYPRVRELRIWLVGGRNMRRWAKPLLEMVEQFARDMDCTVMTGGLRRGWLRIGGPEWVETGAVFEKRLA